MKWFVRPLQPKDDHSADGASLSALRASTLVPGGVEVLLYYLYQSSEYSVTSLLLVATAGNTIGGIIIYFMGLMLKTGLQGLSWYQTIHKLFTLKETALDRVRKWGVPALFFSWMPIIGDPLCLAAGYLQLPFWRCAVMILFSKLSRYAVLLWLF